MSDATEWKSTADRDADAIAVVTGALTDDEDLVAFTLEPLSRQQLVEMCGVIAGWFRGRCEKTGSTILSRLCAVWRWISPARWRVWTMSRERERYLEERGLLPPLYRQLEIRASAVRVARRACHLEGEARRRSEALEAKYLQLAIRARAGESVEWPDE